MRELNYISIPRKQEFQKDSSVTFAFRNDDIILTRIDWLLDRYHEMRPTRRAIMCDLFFTINFWVKSFRNGNPSMRKERYPSVMALFDVLVRTLCSTFECTAPQLSRLLLEIYGRDLHAHGIIVDYGQKRAKVLSRLEAEHFRLRFKGGLAYQYQWWKRKPGRDLVLANSRHACERDVVRKGTDGKHYQTMPDFGCFVMTVERQLYMALPNIGDHGQQNGLFHSSFTGGEVVSMAGTMLIKNGKISGICPDSGHYKPTEQNVALCLQGLAMYGCDLRRIRLYSFDQRDLGDGFSFIQSRMQWATFEKQARDERQNRLDTEDQRSFHNVPSRFGYLKPPAPPASNQPNNSDQAFYRDEAEEAFTGYTRTPVERYAHSQV